MNYLKHLEAFREHLILLNFSDRSVDTYYKEVTHFINFIEKHYLRITSFEKIAKDVIVDYQRYLSQYKTKKGNFLSNTSQRTRIFILNKFFKYLLKNDLILHDPTLYISIPKKETTIVRDILSVEEVKDILESIKVDSPRNLRNKAILELVYATGMRTTECCNLRLTDINLKEQTVIVVRGKGKKSRIIPLTQYASHYVEMYIDKARRYFLKYNRDNPGYLFLNDRGNAFNAHTINNFVIKRILKEAKIKNKNITFYTFRHSIATHLLKNKVDIRYIAQLLGHSSLNTTQVYTHVEISDLKKVHSLTHPREKENISFKEI